MITVNDFLAEYEVSGYSIEMRYPLNRLKRMGNWEVHWNHKLYKTEAVANEAMVHIIKVLPPDYEFRIRRQYQKKI